MFRIDESPKFTFGHISDVLDTIEEINRLLDKTYLSNTARIEDMLKHYKVFYYSLASAPELFEIVNAAFNKSTRFQAWVNTLNPHEQKEIAISLKQDSSSKRYMIKVGNKKPVLSGDNENGYESSEYRERTQSQWLNKHLSKESDENQRIASQIETFIRDERVCVGKMATFRVLLNQYLQDSSLSRDDRDTITRCLTLLDRHQAAYEKLELHSVLNPADQTLEKAGTALSTKYQSSAYGEYHHTIENLYPVIEDVCALADRYPALPSRAEITTTVRALITRPEQSASLLEGLNARMGNDVMDMTQALYTANNRLASFNAIRKFNELLQGLPAEQRKETALRAIISSESLELPYPENSDMAIRYKSTYLENLLTQAFPRLFQHANNVFHVSHPDYDTTLAIYKALGLTSKEAVLNPTNFNAMELNQIAERDETNPVWPLLKILKPCDATFTIKNKIDAYFEVIKFINEGKLTLNNKTPLEQTRFFAKNLVDLIKTPLDKHFIEQQIEAHLELIKLIRQEQFQIDARPPIKLAEDIAASALVFVDKQGAFTPKLVQLFNDIDTAIKLPVTARTVNKITKALTGKSTAVPGNPSVQKQIQQYWKGQRIATAPQESDTDSLDSSNDSGPQKK